MPPEGLREPHRAGAVAVDEDVGAVQLRLPALDRPQVEVPAGRRLIERILHHLACKNPHGLWPNSRAPPAGRGRLLHCAAKHRLPVAPPRTRPAAARAGTGQCRQTGGVGRSIGQDRAESAEIRIAAGGNDRQIHAWCGGYRWKSANLVLILPIRRVPSSRLEISSLSVIPCRRVSRPISYVFHGYRRFSDRYACRSEFNRQGTMEFLVWGNHLGFFVFRHNGMQ